MKKLSSVFYMWVGLGFGLLAVLMMFVPVAQLAGSIVSSKEMFFGNEVYGGAWPSFVGYMFILVGALMMGVMALPMIQPSSQTEKIVLISAGALLLVGGVLVGLIHVLYEANNGFAPYLDNYCAGYFLALSFTAVAIAMDVIALVLDW